MTSQLLNVSHTSFSALGCIFELIVALICLRLLLLAQGDPLVRLESVAFTNDHLRRSPCLSKAPNS